MPAPALTSVVYIIDPFYISIRATMPRGGAMWRDLIPNTPENLTKIEIQRKSLRLAGYKTTILATRGWGTSSKSSAAASATASGGAEATSTATSAGTTAPKDPQPIR